MYKRVKLVRHTFPDRPDWLVMDESTPLGTLYYVLDKKDGFILRNLQTNESRPVTCYLLDGNGDVGWMPIDCFEEI